MPDVIAREKTHESFPQLKYPSLRDFWLKDAYQWLRGKRHDDGAEGLWRIHDDLYDFTQFIKDHPGGQDWLVLTKGTDITEAFECHHIEQTAEKLLPKFQIREAKTPRNSPFTFEDDGFYRTLKQKVRAKMKNIPIEKNIGSILITDTLLTVLLVAAPLACGARNILVLGSAFAVSTLSLSWLTVCSHNYFHQKDNWRMYLFNLSLGSYREWRISHAMSHHLFTNTLLDLEISELEPFFQWFPNHDKPMWARVAFLYSPFVYAFVFLGQVFKKILATVFLAKDELQHYWRVEDFIGFALPLWMWLVSGSSLMYAFAIWVFLIISASFWFTMIGLAAGHHHPHNFYDGDIPRAKNLDWGMHQLDSVMDRSDITGSPFRVLTHFGDHALHHLFPTIDHAALPFLYPLFLNHCDKHRARFRMTTQLDAYLGNFRQLARIDKNDFTVHLTSI